MQRYQIEADLKWTRFSGGLPLDYVVVSGIKRGRDYTSLRNQHVRELLRTT